MTAVILMSLVPLPLLFGLFKGFPTAAFIVASGDEIMRIVPKLVDGELRKDVYNADGTHIEKYKLTVRQLYFVQHFGRFKLLFSHLTAAYSI